MNVLKSLMVAALVFGLSSAVFAADPKRNLAVVKTPDAAQAKEQRVALVIGNSAYKVSPLKNPANDAEDIAKALRGLGFQVTLKQNQGRDGMAQAIREFGNQLKQGGTGLFYYAGHGMQVKGKNFLIPVDADIQSEDEVPYRSIDANELLAKMESARNRVNLVVLDACRNNPFGRSFRSASQGLAQMDAPVGTLVAFATAPGSVAADGQGRNGLYTQHLLASMNQPGLKIEDVFKRVRQGVRRGSGDKQVPWENTSLEGDFYFKPGQAGAAPAADPLSIELAYWESIKDSTGADDYSAYLDRYPSGQFSNLAKSRIAAFRKGGSGGPAQPSSIAESVADDPASSAQVVIFRKSAFIGMSIELPVTIDGKFIGVLGSGTYLNLNLNAGLHQISVSKKSGSTLRGTCHETISVAPGKKYFLEANTGEFGQISDCGLVRADESDGVSQISGLARRN